MAKWFLHRVPPYIRTATIQRRLARPDTIDQLKSDMLNGKFRFESAEGRVSGWRDESGVYYIEEGHHRINAALEILWSTNDESYLRRLLDRGCWTDGKPAIRRRFPTRRAWDRVLKSLGW